VNYFRNVDLAHRAWKEANLARAEALLNDCPPELRGWEWHYVDRLCHAQRLTLPADVPSTTNFLMAFSPDGSRLAATGPGGTVQVWDTRSGALLRTLPPRPRGRVWNVAFDPSGRQLIVGSEGGVQLLDAESGRLLTTLGAPVSDDSPTAAAWAAAVGAVGTLGALIPDKSFAVSGSRVATWSTLSEREHGGSWAVRVWDLESWEELRCIGTPTFAARLRDLPGSSVRIFTYAALGRGGRRLGTIESTAPTSNSFRIWDVPSGKELRAIYPTWSSTLDPFYFLGGVRLAFGRNGAAVIGINAGGEIRVWDANTGDLQGALPGRFEFAEIDPDGDRMLTGEGGTVHVRALPTLQVVRTLRAHAGRARTARLSPDGAQVATAGDDGIKFWDAGDPEATSVEVLLYPIAAVFTPDGLRVFGESQAQVPYIVDTRSGAASAVLKPSQAMWDSGGAAISRDGERVAAQLRSAEFVVSDARTGRVLKTLGKINKMLSAVAFSPDGERVAAGANDGEARVWDLDSGRMLATYRGHQKRIKSIDLSPDGRPVVTTDGTNTARVWDAATGADGPTLRGHASVTHAAFSPDGGRIVTSSSDGTAKVWDARTGAEFYTLRGQTGADTVAAFSPDGGRIVTAGFDAVQLWDSATGLEIVTLSDRQSRRSAIAFSPGSRVSAVAFSPDGNRIVVLRSYALGPGLAQVFDGSPRLESAPPPRPARP
jgi:WD40 repeat protein